MIYNICKMIFFQLSNKLQQEMLRHMKAFNNTKVIIKSINIMLLKLILIEHFGKIDYFGKIEHFGKIEYFGKIEHCGKLEYFGKIEHFLAI